MMLNPHEYEHKFDKKAHETLNKIPGLEKYCRNELKDNWERRYKLVHTGSSIKVTRNQFPKVYEILEQVCNNIYLKTIPDLYIQSGLHINAFTFGSERPSIWLTSGAVEYLTPDELVCIIGHEAGHIKSGHVLYKMMARKITKWGTFLTDITLGLGGMLQESIESSFMYWNRMSEFTADRAGLLACQDINTAISLEMKLSGVPPKLYDEMDLNEFIKQAQEFNSFDSDALDSYYKELLTIDRTHPWTVVRAFELLKWVESGEYHQLIESHSNIDKNMVRCPKCGYIQDGDEIYCGSCGKKLWTR